MCEYHETIPVFFASDDNYAPFLSVAIMSMLENASKEYNYRIHILNSGLSRSSQRKLAVLATENSEICFENMSERLGDISSRLHTRDYYSAATYYRLFIAEIFREYDKALYIDADTVIEGDVSKLYTADISGNLVGAICEDVMSDVDVFGEYAETVLGVPRENYFNAGVLVMNLKRFRELKIEQKFMELLGKYKFEVTQDQDYLNVLCRGRVHYFGYEWNKSPFNGVSGCIEHPEIIHFKLNWKPWHYDGTMYEESFWRYVARSEFRRKIAEIKSSYTLADRLNDRIEYENLMSLAADCTAACSGDYGEEYHGRVCAF